MATAVANQVTQPITCKEENGSVVEVVSTAHITGITGASATARFQDAYDALDTAGFTFGSSTSEYTALRLIRRDVEFLPNQTTQAYAQLTYQTVGLGFEIPGVFYPEISASLQQIETNFDIYGNQIVVSHTYPADDQNYPSETLEVTAKVPQLSPQGVITYKGLEYSDVPIALQQQYVGRKNSTFWNGGAPGTWLCVDIQAQPRDLSQAGGNAFLWDWAFTFQYDPSGWDQQAIFLDPQTNKPPINIVDGVGVVNVEVQPAVDFNALIPAF